MSHWLCWSPENCTDKDGIDQSFHCQAYSPKRIHDAISRGETARLSGGVVATVLLYAIIKFNVWLFFIYFFNLHF